MTENQYLDGTYAAARLEGWAQLANPYQFVGSQKSCLQISMNKDRFAWKATRRQSFTQQKMKALRQQDTSSFFNSLVASGLAERRINITKLSLDFKNMLIHG